MVPSTRLLYLDRVIQFWQNHSFFIHNSSLIQVWESVQSDVKLIKWLMLTPELSLYWDKCNPCLQIRDSVNYIKDAMLWKQPFERLTHWFISYKVKTIQLHISWCKWHQYKLHLFSLTQHKFIINSTDYLDVYAACFSLFLGPFSDLSMQKPYKGNACKFFV
jgi:hypothetical protein